MNDFPEVNDSEKIKKLAADPEIISCLTIAFGSLVLVFIIHSVAVLFYILKCLFFRSSVDDYTPPSSVDFIQSYLIMCLKNCYKENVEFFHQYKDE